jgi:hypothetical protein
LYTLEFESVIDKIKRFLMVEYNTRPVGAVYLGLISLYGKNTSLYIIQNLIVWFASVIIISDKLKKEFNEKIANQFLLLSLFPSICSTVIFSSIVQSLGVISLFLWALSIKFVKSKFVSFTLIILAFLAYETAIILFSINIYFWTKGRKINFFLLLQYIFYFIILMVILFFIQNTIAKFTNNYSTLKYFFHIKNGEIFIEQDFIYNLRKYFFKPFELIIIEIPILFFRSIKFFTWDLKNIFLLLTFFLIIILIFFKKKNEKVEKSNLIFFYLLIALLINFLLYLVATSVPQVNGYYNRGLVALFIILSLFLSLVFNLKIKSNMKFISNVFFISIILLNYNSFNIQKSNYIQNNIEQKKIINNFLNLSYQKISPNDKNIILAMVPTFNGKNYNDEFIFSEEMNDIEHFFKIKYSKNVSVRRIYYDNNCQNIFNLDQNVIVGKQPPSSRKETIFTTKIIVKDANNHNIYVYSYNNGIFKVSKDNIINLKNLHNITKCSIY